MDNSIADARTADVAVEMATMPRFEDGCINLQELLRQLAESVVNEIMSAEADQLCEATHNSRNGYRERRLTTCVGTLTPGIPKLRVGSFFPDDVIERYQRVDRANEHEEGAEDSRRDGNRETVEGPGQRHSPAP